MIQTLYWSMYEAPALPCESRLALYFIADVFPGIVSPDHLADWLALSLEEAQLAIAPLFAQGIIAPAPCDPGCIVFAYPPVIKKLFPDYQPQPRDEVSQYLRQKVYERDGRRCVYCGATERLSIDHVIPKSKGGKTEEDNLATACKGCNSSKRDKPVDEWKASRKFPTEVTL